MVFYKCICPDKFSAQKILLSLVRLDRALTHDDSGVSIQAHLEIVDFEFGETMSPVMLFKSSRLFTMVPSGQTTVQFSASRRLVYELSPFMRFRPVMLDLNERLLILRVLFHQCLIVCQTRK